MTLPALEKTWQFDVNQHAGGTGDNNTDCRDILMKIKASLLGFASNPWVVRSCSWYSSGWNVANGDYIDHWTIGDNIRAGAITNPANFHSWIVLEQTGTGYNMCIDLGGSDSIYGALVVGISASGYNLDGTTKRRPTASDDIAVNYGNWHDNGLHNVGLHVMQSTDGECTRIIHCFDHAAESMWMMDKAKNPVTGWTDPVIGFMLGQGNAADYYLNRNDYATKGYLGGVMKLYISGEGYANLLVQSKVNVPDDDTGEWLLSPMGLVCEDYPNRGRRGEIFDMWWGGPAIADGTTFPGDGSGTFVQFRGAVFPWNGTVPLIW